MPDPYAKKTNYVLVILVLKQLTVSTGESITRLTKELQRLLLVDVTKHRPLCGNTYCFWNTDEWVLEHTKISIK